MSQLKRKQNNKLLNNKLLKHNLATKLLKQRYKREGKCTSCGKKCRNARCDSCYKQENSLRSERKANLGHYGKLKFLKRLI